MSMGEQATPWQESPPSGYPSLCRSDVYKRQGFRFKRHESLGLPEEHLQAIEKHLEGRVRKLLAIPTRHLKQEKAR